MFWVAANNHPPSIPASSSRQMDGDGGRRRWREASAAREERRGGRLFGMDPTKNKIGEIKFFDEEIDDAKRRVLADPVFQAFRKQRGLRDGPPHRRAPRPAKNGKSYRGNQNRRCVSGWVICSRAADTRLARHCVEAASRRTRCQGHSVRDRSSRLTCREEECQAAACESIRLHPSRLLSPRG